MRKCPGHEKICSRDFDKVTSFQPPWIRKSGIWNAICLYVYMDGWIYGWMDGWMRILLAPE
jgi:hypothetical protein